MGTMLGLGYSKWRGELLGSRCLELYEEEVIYHPVGRILYSSKVSKNIKENEFFIGGKAEAKIDLGLYDISVAGESISYQENIRETDYSISYNFSLESILGEKRLNLVKYGTDSLISKYRDHFEEDEFRKECGEEFVIKAYYGSYLSISASLEFKTKHEKYKFSAGKIIKNFMKFIGVNLSGELNEYRAKLTVSVIQTGGEISDLQSILSEDWSWNVQYGILECDSFDQCSLEIKKFLYYASNIYPNQGVRGGMENAEVMSYDTLSYDGIGIELGEVLIDQQAREMMIWINVNEQELKRREKFIDKLLDSDSGRIKYSDKLLIKWQADDIEEKSRNKILELKSEIKKELERMDEKKKGCYSEDMINCAGERSEVSEELKDLEERFGHNFEISTICGEEQKSRKLLPVGIEGDSTRYQEKIEFLGQDYEISYQIIKREEELRISAELRGDNNNNECEAVIERNRGEYYDDWYLYSWNSNISLSCRKILCLNGTLEELNNIEVSAEWIYIETIL